MSKEERIAIQNVVGGRQPKLIQLQPEESEDEVDDDEGEVVEELGELGGVTMKLLEPETTLTESPTRADTKTPPREKKCQDCGFTCRLQIQMNRHKNLCVKKEGSSARKASPGSKWKLKVKERKKSDEGSFSKRKRSFQEEDNGKKSKKSPYVSPGKGKPCPECNKEFRNQAVLDRHFEDLHQPGEFPCPGDEKLCGKVFTSRNKMSSHYSRNCNPNNPVMLVQGNVLQPPDKSVQMLSSRFQGRLMKRNARLNTPKSVANPVVVDMETDVIFKLLCRLCVDLKLKIHLSSHKKKKKKKKCYNDGGYAYKNANGSDYFNTGKGHGFYKSGPEGSHSSGGEKYSTHYNYNKGYSVTKFK